MHQDSPNPSTISLRKVAGKRLYPSLTDPSFLVLRSRRLIFTSWIKQFRERQLNVLDVGGRYQPYRPLLDSLIAQYIAVDVIKTELVSVVASGEALPFAPESFDVVIATQVFEYFEKPHVAAMQIHSALKPGGALLASVAACLPRVATEEYWRFTPSGVQSMLSPFAKIEVQPEVSNVGNYFRLTNLAFNSLLPWTPVREAYNLLVCPIVNLIGLGLESLELTKNDEFASGYSVLAIKG